jgi:hypothetical protein
MRGATASTKPPSSPPSKDETVSPPQANQAYTSHLVAPAFPTITAAAPVFSMISSTMPPVNLTYPPQPYPPTASNHGVMSMQVPVKRTPRRPFINLTIFHLLIYSIVIRRAIRLKNFGNNIFLLDLLPKMSR